MYQLPTVQVTYKGKPLSEKYFSEHPEIQLLYPSKEVFMSQLYIPLLQAAQESGKEQILEISENTIKINGVLQSRI
jgi:hypothetical protein